MFIERNLKLADVLKRKSVFLFGPRQCGKSSLVEHELADAHLFDLLSSDTLFAFPATQATSKRHARTDA